MHRSNNAVIMQTEQLGRIKALEEELRSSKGKVADLEQKMMEQDRVIAQLVGDNPLLVGQIINKNNDNCVKSLLPGC